MTWQEAKLYRPGILEECKFSFKGNGRYKNHRKDICSTVLTFDTETTQYTEQILFVTDWSFTVGDQLCVEGHKVQDAVEMFKWLNDQADEQQLFIIYVHYLPYDYVYIRNHMLREFGLPDEYLMTRPHKYLYIRWDHIEFRDSYMLTQKSLDKLCKDMGVTHKASGKWDYHKFRTPGSPRTDEEREYFLTDTIALNEALTEFFKQRGINPVTTELTATGFIRKRGLNKMKEKDPTWHNKGFQACKFTLDQYKVLLQCYHGGYTHGNRFLLGVTHHNVMNFDFTSSYPARACYNKFPMGPFFDPGRAITFDHIVNTMDQYAYMGFCYVEGLRCSPHWPMPSLAEHKCTLRENAKCDNGKIVSADRVVFPFSDPDLVSFSMAYDYDKIQVFDVFAAEKDFLPDFIRRDLLMELFQNKCTLKGVDPVNYQISKGEFNGVYGCMVQKPIQNAIEEDFQTGEMFVKKIVENSEQAQEQLDKFFHNWKKYLLYQWGVYVTSYAQQALFEFGSLATLPTALDPDGYQAEWLYSDTDSVKCTGIDLAGVEAYNRRIVQQAEQMDIGIVNYDGRRYVLGYAERDPDYLEFRYLGSKRYCARSAEDGKLHLTVAGVPKAAVVELHDDINNFYAGRTFCTLRPGENQADRVEKNAAVYIDCEGVKTVKIGDEIIEYGSAVRLDPVEYTLDAADTFDKALEMALYWDTEPLLSYEDTEVDNYGI